MIIFPSITNGRRMKRGVFSPAALRSTHLAPNSSILVSNRGMANLLDLLKLKDKHDQQVKKKKAAKKAEAIAQKQKQEAEKKFTEVPIKDKYGRTRRLTLQEIKIKYDTKDLLGSGQILTMDYILVKDDEVRHQFFGGLCTAYRRKSHSFWLLNHSFGERIEMLGYFSSPMLTNMKINNKYRKEYNKSKLYYMRDREIGPYELDIVDVEDEVLKKAL